MQRGVALLTLMASLGACGDDEPGRDGVGAAGGTLTSAVVATSVASAGSGGSTPGEGGGGTAASGSGGGGGDGGDGGDGGTDGVGGAAPAVCFPPSLRVAADDTTTCALDDAGGGACRGGSFGASWVAIELNGEDAPARCIDAIVAQGSARCIHVTPGANCSEPGVHCHVDGDGWRPLSLDVDARWIAVTDDDVCGVDVSGRVACVREDDPADLAASVPLAGISGGPHDTCAWSAAGITCWGEHAALAADAPDYPGCVADVDVGPGFACTTYSGLDIVDCWGDLPRGVLERAFLPAPGVDVAVGDAFVCVLTEGGFVRCWGDNAEGGLGVPDPDDEGGVEPMWPGELPVVTAIGAGRGHAGVVTDDGAVLAWGANGEAQICPCEEPMMLPTDTSFPRPL